MSDLVFENFQNWLNGLEDGQRRQYKKPSLLSSSLTTPQGVVSTSLFPR